MKYPLAIHYKKETIQENIRITQKKEKKNERPSGKSCTLRKIKL